MGTVYEGRHLGTRRRVAVKVLTSEMATQPAFVARFEIEAKSAGQIESRHIAQVLDVGTHGAHPYLVMEYLDGEDLQQLIRRVGPLPPDLAIRIVAQACAGLAKAHEAGIIHRDIKPANIFLARQDGDVVVKLVDFGIAKMRSSNEAATAGLTSPGKIFGSPLYMSPEQIRGGKHIDHRSDLWSLGIVLYECLCGATPYDSLESLPQLIFAICSKNVPSLLDRAPWLQPSLLNIAWRALQVDLAHRYASANDFWQELRAASPGGTTIEEAMIRLLPKRIET
jgi:serine/threonine protein kinase